MAELTRGLAEYFARSTTTNVRTSRWAIGRPMRYMPMAMAVGRLSQTVLATRGMLALHTRAALFRCN
ncbi:hypothetical protein YTPLAS72_12300 [Nitrospira sp.]|nr:hypothetical protein YTPLAS72_12300 [Nitrospira sp.]